MAAPTVADRATATRRAREQSRAALPGRDRLHRARRRSRVLGALRRRQPDDPPDADLVDRPLAPLEAADPLPRPPLPGRHVRRPRQRALRPPDRGRRLRRHGVRRRRHRRHGRDRHRPGGGRGAVDGRRVRGAARRRAPGPRHRPVPVRLDHPGQRSQAGRPGRRSRCRLRRGRADDEGWHKYNAHYWRRDWPGFAAWFSGEARVHGAALDQGRSRTPSAGSSRPIPRR